MSNLHDQDIKRYYELLDTVPGKQINTALVRKQLNKQKARNHRLKVLQLTLVAAALLFLTFASSIRFSPEVAKNVAEIPIFEPIVKIISPNKGIQDIIENDYIEEINASQTNNGHKLTITHVIVDEFGMIIYYKYKADEDLSVIRSTDTYEVIHAGKPIEASISTSWYALAENTFEVENSIHITSATAIPYENGDFILNFSLLKDIEFSIPFSLTKDLKQSKYIDINETITIDEQQIHLHKLVVTPLRTQLVLTVDPNNTKDILHFGQIILTDENGEEWSEVSGGVVGHGSIDEENYSLYLESNYFRMPKELTITFSNIEGIDKERSFIEFDFIEGTFETTIENVPVQLTINEPNYLMYTIDSNFNRELKPYFHKLIDTEGNEFYGYSNTMGQNELGAEGSLIFDFETPPANPVRLYVNRFDQYLSGEASITVQIK